MEWLRAACLCTEGAVYRPIVGLVMRSSTDAREEEDRRKLASERDDSSLASSPRYEDKPTNRGL